MHASRVQQILRSIGVLAIIAWSLGPVMIGLVTSLSTEADVQAVPAHWLPDAPTIASYQTLLGGDTIEGGIRTPSEVKAFGSAMGNTALVTLEAVVACVVVSVFAGYAFSRLRFFGRRAAFVALVVTLEVPVFALLAPLFQLMAGAHLIDTQLGLVLVYVSAQAPLAVWLLYNYCRELPIEPEEAALIDGCGRFAVFWRIALPQMRSGIAAVSAIVMLSVWGQFLVPLLFAPTIATKPVTVLITEFVGKYNSNQPLIVAAGMLALLPPAVVAIVLNKQIRGMLSGWSN
ncbi:MAG: carbohydrate ABC transporter permease [Candidatus Limnocylindrales bacterium]